LSSRAAVITAVLSLLACFVRPGAARAQETWTTLPNISLTQPTEAKPQSKAWFHGHTWWTILATDEVTPAGTWLLRLEPDATWSFMYQISTNTGSEVDVKSVGDVVHVLIRNSTPELVSLEYVPGSDTYQPWSVRPTSTPVYIGETGTIDIDSTGRMWLATDFNLDIEVYYSDYPYTSFSGPVVLASGVKGDDIGAVTALPNGTVGVFWSNQIAQRFGFRVHEDGTDPAVWLADEVPASQSAVAVGSGMADDHMNLAVASDGTLYAAVKTGFHQAPLPNIALLVRRPDASGPGGTWDDMYFVDPDGTRPIVVLNDVDKTLRVFYTGLAGIEFRESALDPISFGPAQTPIPGAYNDVTSSKDPWHGRLLIVASGDPNLTGLEGAAVVMTPDPGLVGYWKMEEPGGPLRDVSGWGNDADIVGSPAWVPGANGLALDLDGTSRAVVSDQAQLDATTGLTISAWLQPGADADQDVISRAIGGSVDGYTLGLSSSSSPTSPRTVFLRLNEASSGHVYQVNSISQYPSSGATWIHVTATYDGAMMRMFINGVEEASAPGPASIAAQPVDLGIGAQADGARPYRGAIDEVKIYDRAVGAPEAAALAANPPPLADLAIVKSDSLAKASPGQAVSYSIVATNNGPTDVFGATVSDPVPPELTNVTWTCVPAGAATCIASGSGSLFDVVDLPAGSSVTYTLDATVAATASGSISNTAFVRSSQTSDFSASNNQSTDTDFIPTVFSYYDAFARYPATDGGSSGSATTVAIAPPAGMSSGQLAVVIAAYRSNGNVGQSVDVSEPGGQTWHAEPAFQTPTGQMYVRVFWTQFTGAWSANPSFALNTGGSSANAFTLYGLVFNASSPVVVDVPFTALALGSTSSFVHDGVSPAVNGELVIGGFAQADDAAMSAWTTGWTNANGETQWRNQRGDDSAVGVVYRIGPPGPTGALTATSSKDKDAMGFMLAFRGVATVPIPPSITTQPSDVAVTAPSPATFSVVADGDPTLTYQWQRNGIDILGATSATYTLTPTQGSDDGATFRVVVNNPVGPAVTSAAATLTVHAVPGITTDPAAVTVTEPAPAAFTVVASGGGLSYQWRRDGADIPGATSSTYVLDPTAVGDDGALFDVVVTNVAGSATSAAALLTVNPAPVAPSITTHPASVIVTEPAPAAFTVAASGDAPLSYQWRRNGADIPGATSSTYVLDPTTVGDSGALFDVVVTNVAGSATSTVALLTVNPAPVPPSITADPVSVVVTEPAPASFTVGASGDAPLAYQWRRNGADIPGATGSTYVLDPTAVGDSGSTFDVVVINGAGSATSAAALLTVNPAPVAPSITTDPLSVIVTEPAPATFTVVAAGDAPLTYQWRRNGADIPGATSSTYVLDPTAIGDDGATFDVVVTNGVGSATSAAALLTVNPAPVPPSITADPVSVTVTEPAPASFTVAAAGDAPLSYQWRRNGADIPGATSSTYVLDPTGLGDSGAMFDVVVTNGVGSATSAAALLTVNPAPIPPAITSDPADVTVTEPAPASFTVAATGSAPLSYQWRRNGVPIAGATSDTYVLDPTALGDSGAQFDVVVTNAGGTATSAAALLGVNPAPGGSVNKVLTTPSSPVPSDLTFNDNRTLSEYGVAVWAAPNPADSLLFVSQKKGNIVDVWNLQTRQIVDTLTGLNHPLGMAVDRTEGALYVASERTHDVQKFLIADIQAGAVTASLVFGGGMSPSSDPQSVAVRHVPGSSSVIYVTYSGSSQKYVRAFATDGTLLQQWSVGSIGIGDLAVDEDHGLIYVGDKASDVIKAYQLDGTFVQDIGTGDFGPNSDVEGLAIYRCGADGYIVASDQQNSEFEIFDRLTFSHLATFKLEGTQQTIGVAIAQGALPGYPNGAFFAESHDQEIVSTSWNAIAAATGVSICAAP
jgi:uncharacterized repeat protein (TIGR01451 family)